MHALHERPPSQLEHADAEYLASVLEPFLSPEGKITPHRPTNTLIIKDRAPVVNMLSEVIKDRAPVVNMLSVVIKGKPCVPVSEQPEAEIAPQHKEGYLEW
jgi:hypothetical protein